MNIKVSKIIEKVDIDINSIESFISLGNYKMISNFEILKQSGKPYLIRTQLIPNITDTKEIIEVLKKIIGDSDWEKLPYNEMAGAKYKKFGMKYFI